MQSSHSIIAVGIGTVIILNPWGGVSAQPTSTENTAETNALELTLLNVSPVESFQTSPERLSLEQLKPLVIEVETAESTAITSDTEANLETPVVVEVANEPNEADEAPVEVAQAVPAEAAAAIAPDQGEAQATDVTEVAQEDGSAQAETELVEEADSSTDNTETPSSDIDPEALELSNDLEAEAEVETAEEADLETADEDVIEPLSGDEDSFEEESEPEADLEPEENDVEVDPELEAELEAAETTAPEFLYPHPNPLYYPTSPEQVEIDGTEAITLEQAIELARQNNQEILQSQLELEQAEAALREVRASELPTLDANANLTGQEVQQQNDFGSNLSPELRELFGIEDQADQGNNSIDFNLGASLELNYNLYTAGQRSALIEAAKRRVEFQELQVEVLTENLELTVTNQYYDLQEADEQVRIAQTALDEALRSLRDATALENAGVGTRFERLQAEVDVANSRQDLTEAVSQQATVRRQLVQTLALAQDVNVAAADPVQVAGLWEPSLEETIVLAYQNRAELEQQLLQRAISEQQRRAALAERGPIVALFANYNVQTAIDENDDISDSYQFGARATLNLFDGGAARAAADQEEANIAIAELEFARVRDEIRFQVEESYLDLQANFDNIQTASLAVETAREALRLARLRFQAGVGTQTDVLRSQTELTRAEVNLLGAILGYNRALASLQRSVSNLPDNDLSDVP